MSSPSLPEGSTREAAKQPFLSIVTLSFNQADYLRQALESVIKQKSNLLEFIVVDPGSTDGSRDIIAEYRDGIDTVILEPDTGPAYGLNKGFAAARGRIGYFLNSDDFLMPGAVQLLDRQWSAHPYIGLLLGRAWRVMGDGAVERELLPTPNDRTTLASGAATIVQQGFSFSMNAFRAVGGFNAANRSTWDYELLAQFAAADVPFAIVNDRFGAFRLYADGISGGALGENPRLSRRPSPHRALQVSPQASPVASLPGNLHPSRRVSRPGSPARGRRRPHGAVDDEPP